MMQGRKGAETRGRRALKEGVKSSRGRDARALVRLRKADVPEGATATPGAGGATAAQCSLRVNRRLRAAYAEKTFGLGPGSRPS